MKFRKRLFRLLALLALGWIVLGYFASGESLGELKTDINTEYQSETQRDAAEAGAAIGTGIGFTGFFLCPGLLLLAVFGLLSWRNAVGLRNEKRHREMIEATLHSGQAESSP